LREHFVLEKIEKKGRKIDIELRKYKKKQKNTGEKSASWWVLKNSVISRTISGRIANRRTLFELQEDICVGAICLLTKNIT